MREQLGFTEKEVFGMKKLNHPIVTEIGYHTYLIDEYGMASFYVLWGSERGLVIDAGCGSFDARKLIEQLCPKPYDVVLTHGHGDHVGAVSQWEKVWLHPADYERIRDTHRMKEMLWENPAVHQSSRERGSCMLSPAGEQWDYPYLHYAAKEIYELNEDMFMGFAHLPEFLPLENGQTFDLGGGRICEIIHTPGHTAGSCSVLDYESRILFSGDACNVNLGVAGASINSELTGLLRIAAKRDKFDRNYNGHAGPSGDLFCFSMPDSTLDDCIWICRAILNGTADIEEQALRIPDGAAAPNIPVRPGTARHGAVRINFNMCRLIDEGEEPAE